MNVVSRTLLGALAGAAGTSVLDSITYVDMAVRGRPPSELPDKMARKLADMAGYQDFAKPAEELDDKTKNQRVGIAALLGYADGFGSGALFGMVRPYMRDVPWFWAGIAEVGPNRSLELAASSWIEDVVPRCAYGWATVLVYDNFAEG